MAVSRGERTASKPGSDVYTGLLAISLLAMIAGCVFLYLDWSQYSTKKPELPPLPTSIKPAAAAPAQPGR